eukprot:5657512-Pyramimonas_sp.AAC.1
MAALAISCKIAPKLAANARYVSYNSTLVRSGVLGELACSLRGASVYGSSRVPNLTGCVSTEWIRRVLHRAPKSSTAHAVRVAKRSAPMRSAAFLSGASAISHKKNTLGNQSRRAFKVSAAATAEETFQYKAEVRAWIVLVTGPASKQ